MQANIYCALWPTQLKYNLSAPLCLWAAHNSHPYCTQRAGWEGRSRGEVKKKHCGRRVKEMKDRHLIGFVLDDNDVQIMPGLSWYQFLVLAQQGVQLHHNTLKPVFEEALLSVLSTSLFFLHSVTVTTERKRCQSFLTVPLYTHRENVKKAREGLMELVWSFSAYLIQLLALTP